MRNIKLTIEYDGSNYKGWQKQPTEISIQEIIEDAIFKITRDKVKLEASGRTDKGVHAFGQTASFFTNSDIVKYKLIRGLNSVLPDDISIRKVEEVNSEFHARYYAKGKSYKYIIYNSQVRSPIYRNNAYHVPYKLDMNKFRQNVNMLIGTHDFTSFTSIKEGTDNKIRTIYSIDIEQKNEVIELTFKGSGFLYNMIRIIVGTLVDVSRGRIKSNIEEIIDAKNRKRAGITAPSHALYLMEVYY
ncbi:tRNA pseudouridine(38-40) synthase TruA [Senegalia massiliensis]|uniref:tRNA pseudouridine synthase A n=1 Tax=Senegalia massiliensis TaxID=1720316 RepID=A0A845QUZ7_9CLOT|nr:tRNA pseudouridine(38-40) synthase TruA [Senegalia massiliensis]NBI05619.1 tRNA pseudouridine(38-40) synthase TruA [Senegalia massiliensis]